MRIGLAGRAFDVATPLGQDMAGMLDAISTRGAQPFLFTASGQAAAAVDCLHYADLDVLFYRPDDLLIFHYAGEDLAGLAAMRRGDRRTWVRYHGLAPAGAVINRVGGEARQRKAAHEGLVELADLPIEAYLATNLEAREELVRAGVEAWRIHHLPAFTYAERLLALPDDGGVRTSLAAAPINLLAVGGAHPDVSLEMLVDALARASDGASPVGAGVSLHVVGGTPPELSDYAAELAGRIDKRGLAARVTFHEAVGPQTLATFYRGCDALVLAAAEGPPQRAMVEAMAFGLPVITRPRASATEIWGDEGLFADDVRSLAAQVVRLSRDDIFRVRAGRRCREIYEARFARLKLAQSLQLLLDRPRPATPAACRVAHLDWFGLPDPERLVRAAVEAGHEFDLDGRDRRLDLVDWIFRDGWLRSDDLASYVAGDAFQRYVRTLELPVGPDNLTPHMRLTWKFHRPANSRFDLAVPTKATAFRRWYHEEGHVLFAFETARP